MQNKANLGQSQILYNINENNQLQRKMQIGHLVKTNPNEANFIYVPLGKLGALRMNYTVDET